MRKIEFNYLSFLQGDKSYTRPPPISSASYDLYDSCVDDTTNPSMYIVFELDQCYPRYVIKYKALKQKQSMLFSN